MSEKYTEYERNIIQTMRKNGSTYKEIANAINRTIPGIRYFCKHNKIENKEQWFSDEEKAFILENHLNITKVELSKKFNVPLCRITKFLELNNLIKPRYKYNVEIGQEFGKLIVISERFYRYANSGKKIWSVKCECNCQTPKKIVTIDISDLCTERVKSCGCIHSDKMKTCHGFGQQNAIWKSPNEISINFFNEKKKKAAKRKIEWNISIEYLYEIWKSQNGFCPLSNVKLTIHRYRKLGKNFRGTASIDRVDSSKGYIEGNIQFTHKIINKMKWEFNIPTFLYYCDLVTNFKNNNLSYDFEYVDQYRKKNYKGSGLVTGSYINGLKQNAIKRIKKKRSKVVEFNIVPNDCWLQFIWQHGRCNLTGLPLSLEENNMTGSVDRINPNKGYIKDNIQWLHTDVNKMKLDLTMYDFKLWCTLISHYQINKKLL